jgi:uncharacterized membrane protein
MEAYDKNHIIFMVLIIIYICIIIKYVFLTLLLPNKNLLVQQRTLYKYYSLAIIIIIAISLPYIYYEDIQKQ